MPQDCVRVLIEKPMRFKILALLSLASTAFAQVPTKLENTGFEQGSEGQQPPGWFVPQPSLDAGYSVRISTDSPKEGKQCAVISVSGQPGQGFGNMMQVVDAKPWRGKRIRFRAAARFDAGNTFGQAMLWVRVDRVGGAQGFFYNMADRPIRSAQWANYDIVGVVDSDAEYLNVGMMMAGSGKAWIDSVSLGESDGKDGGPAPAKALSARGLDNLVAYTKLLGYVRHFHPSDAVAKADWDAIAIGGIPVAEDAKDPADLAQKLEAYFAPYAPTVRVFVTGKAPQSIAGLASPGGAVQVVTWQNIGFGGGNIKGIYTSKRIFSDPGSSPDPAKTFKADLGAGVTCIVPTALYARDGAALPKTADPKPLTGLAPATGDDRTTRLADVALAWNVYEHFYPYFDVVKTDWPGTLRQSLTSAATDADARAFLDTMRRLVSSSQDGHGNANHMSDMAYAQPPIRAAWVEGKFIVTQVGKDVLKPRVGDEILKIGGKKVEDLWNAQAVLISGATEQWKRYRAEMILLAGADGSTAEIEAARGTGDSYTVNLKRAMGFLPETRPKAIEQIKPGIWYVDLDGQRISMEEYKKAIPDLAKAKGIVFDMRGYPNEVAMDVLPRLSDRPVTSALWNVPKVSKPDHVDMEFMQSRWPETGPLEPRFKAKIAFITDGRAISYAESVMGIVENYKLGEIIGEPTAGTNGNINPFTLPGGYTLIFTGMKVVKHDGSVHHGVGIKPTIPTSRTIAGVMAKKDELLDKAVQVVGG